MFFVCLFYSPPFFSTTMSHCLSHITLLQAISSSSSQLQFTTASQFSTYVFTEAHYAILLHNTYPRHSGQSYHTPQSMSKTQRTTPFLATTNVLGAEYYPILLHQPCSKQSALPNHTPPLASQAIFISILPSFVIFHMLDIRCHLSDVRSQMSDIICPILDVKCLMSGARCDMSDIKIPSILS